MVFSHTVDNFESYQSCFLPQNLVVHPYGKLSFPLVELVNSTLVFKGFFGANFFF